MKLAIWTVYVLAHITVLAAEPLEERDVLIVPTPGLITCDTGLRHCNHLNISYEYYEWCCKSSEKCGSRKYICINPANSASNTVQTHITSIGPSGATGKSKATGVTLTTTPITTQTTATATTPTTTGGQTSGGNGTTAAAGSRAGSGASGAGMVAVGGLAGVLVTGVAVLLVVL